MPQSEEQKRARTIRKFELFDKHIIQGKTVTKCAEEMGIQRTQLQLYKRDDDFRQMAIQHIEDSDLGGLTGTVSQLIDMCKAEKPITLESSSIAEDGSSETHQEVKWVADNNARDKAIGKVLNIYGVKAPKQTDVNVEVSFSSDSDLFGQIEEAARACKFVQAYEKRKDGFGLASDPSGTSKGDFGSRERTLLQRDAVFEPERHEPELAVSDNLEHANIQGLRGLRSKQDRKK